MSPPHDGERVESEYPCGNEPRLCAPDDPHPVCDVDLGNDEHEACAATDLQVSTGLDGRRHRWVAMMCRLDIILWDHAGRCVSGIRHAVRRFTKGPTRNKYQKKDNILHKRHAL